MNLYSTVYKILKGFMLDFLYPTEVVGEIPKLPDGPIVLCANHQSGADVFFLIGYTPRQITFMAKKELFAIPLLGGFLKAMGAFPVDRGNSDIAAIKKGLSSLKKGEVLGVFPQGTRYSGIHPAQTKDKLHNGAAMMALRTGATILPVAIECKNFKVKPFKKHKLHYGTPFTFEECNAIYQENKDYSAVTAAVFDRILEMLPKE